MLRPLQIVWILSLFFCLPLGAKTVGRDVASKYMSSNKKAKPPSYQDVRLFSIYGGMATESTRYLWKDEERVRLNGEDYGFGLSYELGEFTSGIDSLIRIDYQRFIVGEDQPVKLSFSSVLTLPESSSYFPIYFGLGPGLGIFLEPVEGESNITLDFQMFLGIRLLDIWKSFGIMIEGGMRNHFNILSDGQVNQTFLSTGFVFTI